MGCANSRKKSAMDAVLGDINIADPSADADIVPRAVQKQEKKEKSKDKKEKKEKSKVKEEKKDKKRRHSEVNGDAELSEKKKKKKAKKGSAESD